MKSPAQAFRIPTPLSALRRFRSRLSGLAAIILLFPHLSTATSPRTTLSLDGTWEIADSRGADDMPTRYERTVPVPGLANLARPGFPDVDRFISRENLANRIRSEEFPAEWMRTYWTGKVEQDRNYFWYRRTFRAPQRRELAWLRINKAQFGTAVWLNGVKLGEYPGCFSASTFPVEQAIRWGEDNTVVVRIGAHPAVLPDTFPTGADFEKNKWTPGIYDSVALIACENPAIEWVQVAPRLATSEIVVQTRLRNHGPTTVRTELAHAVKPWKSDDAPLAATSESLELMPGETRTLTCTIKLPKARWWSPEDPFLYVVESTTAGDSLRTRFGMREFRFSAETQRAHLNGEVIYLRGSNIALHRFFEDPLCGDLPWNEAWVRRLLGELPRALNWNFFRFTIGPVPDRWFEICDELGLLVQNEFFIWTGSSEWYPGLNYSRRYDPNEMIRQYTDWMRDHWNHPSVVVWDPHNETSDEQYGRAIIPAVRSLDLSDRPWESNFNNPLRPDDPVEYHPYFMQHAYRSELRFRLTDLETSDGALPPGPRPNPGVLNEYGWLWLQRDGTPTVLAQNIYAQLLAPDATPRQRLDWWAYLLAAKTEYWRAHRHFAAVNHFVYLTGSFPGAYTTDHFRDPRTLELDPMFTDYVGESFKPLGVYLNFFQPKLTRSSTREFLVKLVNDWPKPLSGSVELTLETRQGKVLARAVQPFALGALGAGDVTLTLSAPAEPAHDLLLVATARPSLSGNVGPTRSRRWVDLSR